jgi:hypothetical protein
MLPSGILVTALLRRINDNGGFGAVLARGDAQAGSILLVIDTPNDGARIKERGIGPEGNIALIDTTPTGDIAEYWQRRRRADPDIWVIELVGADAERFAAETLLDD